MSSRRMSISALLSNNASPPPQSPSPAVASTSDEPPLKRQRQHQGYSQQYYDSYNAYAYSPSTSSSPTSRYYPTSQPQQRSHSSGDGSPSAAFPIAPRTWSPHSSVPLPPAESGLQFDERPRYAPPGAIAASGAFEFVRPHCQTSNLRGAEDDDGRRDVHFQHSTAGKGQSIGGVLSDQMRAPQTHTALPVPPQLRRDVQYSHPSYVASAATDPPPPTPARICDASPLAVKITTPQSTPQSLSPQSSYSPHHISPTASYSAQSASPTAQAAQSSYSMYLRQNASPATYPSPKTSPVTYVTPKISPTMTYFPSRPSSHTRDTTTVSPVASHASHLSQTSPSTSYGPTTRDAAALYDQGPPPSVSPVASRALVQIPQQVPEAKSPSLKLPPSVAVDVDENRSLEDELLSLVDGEDVKPKVSRPAAQLPPSEPSSGSENRKQSAVPSKHAAKSKLPPKARAPAKSSKIKGATKQASATGTPAPASSMPPPSPPPTKQQPAVVRAKGKTATKATKKKGVGASAVCSRSLSVKPAESTPTPAPDVEVTHEEDKLYCVCKTPYDEDKIMIACDRCDEWYHPACVGMPEVEVDLVDQYICESCAKLAEQVGLQTTYKQRCHRGLKYIASHDTLPTCWKPARGAFSKYCSDDCGMAHIQAKILQSGRDAASLLPAVKTARRREGVTVANGAVKTEEPDQGKGNDLERTKAALMEARKAIKEADERELAELLRRLEEIMTVREACKAALERVTTRRRLLDLAVDRAVGRCGWDVRLEMSDEEWSEWAVTEEGRRALDGGEGEDEEQWWCQGPEKCPRHHGWRNIRDLDVQAEVDSKNSSIKQLTDRERELRRRIEDINPPSAPARQHGKSGGKKKIQGKRSTHL